MLGWDVASALPGLRASAESLMVDVWRVSRAGEPVWDEDAGEWSSGASTVYEGPGRLRFPGVGGRRVDEQGAAVTVQEAVLSLPVDGGSGDVRVDDVAECLVARNDAALVGVRVRVDELHWQSQATARRFGVEVES